VNNGNEVPQVPRWSAEGARIEAPRMVESGERLPPSISVHFERKGTMLVALQTTYSYILLMAKYNVLLDKMFSMTCNIFL